MANLSLIRQSQTDKPVRLAVRNATPRQVARLAALPGATAHTDWVSFPMEPNRIADITRLTPETLVTREVSDWLARWKVKIAKSLEMRTTDGKDWDVSDIPFGETLYPYQRTGVAWLRAMRRCILGDEMGLGKTLQGLGAAYDSRSTLVVTVSLAKRSVWEAHIRRYLPGKRVYVCDGERVDRQKTLKTFKQNGSEGIVVINHDMLQGRFRAAYATLYGTEWDTVIVDEAHLFQDHRSSRSQGAAALSTDRLYLLTGTPVWNRPESVFGLLKLISPARWSSFWAFVNEYCDVVMTPWSRDIVGIKPDMLEALRTTLAPVILRRVQSDPTVARQLPELRVQTITYDMTAEQRRAYKTLKRAYQLLDAQGAVVKYEPSASQAFADMRRLVNDPTLLGLGFLGGKAPVLFELLEEALSEDRKVVIFTWHQDYTKALQFWLLKNEVTTTRIDGSIPENERESALRAFQTDPDVKVLVASIATTGVAIDLTVASVAIFAEGSFTAAHIDQAIKRLHRHGQTVDTMIYRLQARNTVEQALWDVVDERTAQASEMLAFRRASAIVLAQED